MRANVAALPTPLRLALGLFTVLVFGFFGMTMRESQPVWGYGLIGLAAWRLSAWIKELTAALKDTGE